MCCDGSTRLQLNPIAGSPRSALINGRFRQHVSGTLVVELKGGEEGVGVFHWNKCHSKKYFKIGKNT
jgi:hypothetical protein